MPELLPAAVLETSFWVVAYRAEVAANLLDLFTLVVPEAVDHELLARNPSFPAREYPYATLFRQLRHHMVDPPEEAPGSLSRFNAGEAEAIPLAQHLRATLLVNERKATTYARNLGLQVLTVPSFIVALRALGVTSDRAARRKLTLIAASTPRAFLVEGSTLLDRIPPP